MMFLSRTDMQLCGTPRPKNLLLNFAKIAAQMLKKVQAIHNWLIHNFEYDYDCDPFIQYFDVRRTLRSHKGTCYDFSHLFAAMCRSQGVPCYVVDGTAYSGIGNHTWNRVYYDGSWWDIDLTFDTVQTAKQGKLYGFRNIENEYSPDSEYWITKIY